MPCEDKHVPKKNVAVMQATRVPPSMLSFKNHRMCYLAMMHSFFRWVYILVFGFRFTAIPLIATNFSHSPILSKLSIRCAFPLHRKPKLQRPHASCMHTLLPHKLSPDI